MYNLWLNHTVYGKNHQNTAIILQLKQVNFFLNKTSWFIKMKVKVTRSCLFGTPWTVYSPLNSLGQDTEVGSLSLLQGTFPSQGWNQVSHIAGRFFTS